MKTKVDLSQAEFVELCLQVVAEMGQHPWKINDGDCESFATMVIDKMGGEDDRDGDGPHLLWGDNQPEFFTPAHDPGYHCYVCYKDSYYDAEEPFGVKSPDMLPLFMRQLLQRDDIRARIHKAVGKMYRK